MFDYLKLSQALNSRLCHEMAGLVGSISTSTELISVNDGAIKSSAQDILNYSSKQLINVLRFYRLAYGLCSETKLTNFSEIENLCEGIKTDRIDITFANSEHQAVDSELAKTILCLIVSAVKSIIKVGSITLSFTQSAGNYIFKIQASSNSLKQEPKKIAVLLGETKQSFLDVDNSHEFYTYYLIKKLGLNINVEQLDNTITYSLSSV